MSTRSRGPNGRYAATTDPTDGGEDNDQNDVNVDSSADTAPEPLRSAGAVPAAVDPDVGGLALVLLEYPMCDCTPK